MKSNIHVYFFENGIIGYSEYHYFYLQRDNYHSPYQRFISIEDRSVSLIVIHPELIVSNYDVKLSDVEKEAIDLISPDDLSLLVMATIPEEIELTSVNLKMPLCLNTLNNKGIHKIILDNVPSKYYIFYELSDMKKKG